ncbi:MAG TPA: ABC transporter substrate-binding protein, partial [Bordetella sp.]|uniref:ABC transporter substrate-binding protein n=1 Tax=Bordetella sp. TaxID=28081 RepID=UPI002ED6AF05
MKTRFEPLSKRKALATCLLAFASLTAAGSAWAAKDAILAINTEPDSLDPYNTNSTLAMAVTKTFYEGLFRFDKDLKIVPVLAESYTVSPDGLVYTFKLRRGVKFQDGTDFNADAVKANIDRVLDKNNHLTRYAQFNRIDKVEAVDPDTVRFTLKEPFAPFLNSLAHPSAAMIS